MIGGHLIWLVERMDRSGDFPKDYTTGIDNGLWWAAVTITTVGYGEYPPPWRPKGPAPPALLIRWSFDKAVA